MPEKSSFKELLEIQSVEEANRLIASGEWALVDTAPGCRGDGTPLVLYVLGRPEQRPAPDIDWV